MDTATVTSLGYRPPTRLGYQDKPTYIVILTGTQGTDWTVNYLFPYCTCNIAITTIWTNNHVGFLCLQLSQHLFSYSTFNHTSTSGAREKQEGSPPQTFQLNYSFNTSKAKILMDKDGVEIKEKGLSYSIFVFLLPSLISLPAVCWGILRWHPHTTVWQRPGTPWCRPSVASFPRERALTGHLPGVGAKSLSHGTSARVCQPEAKHSDRFQPDKNQTSFIMANEEEKKKRKKNWWLFKFSQEGWQEDHS